MSKQSVFSTTIGVLASVINYLYGGWNAVLELLMILVVLDYATGVMAAAYDGKLSSSVGFKGIVKKIAIFIVVFLGHKLDLALQIDWLMNICAFFYISNEFLSLTENLGKIGVPIPEPLKKAVESLKEKSDKSA